MNFKLIFVSCWLCQVCLFHILYDKLVVFSPRIRAKKRTQSNKKIKRPRITYYCVFGQLLFLFQFAECAFFIIVVVRSMPFDLFRVCFLSPFCELIYYGCVWLTEWDTVFGLAITILTNNTVEQPLLLVSRRGGRVCSEHVDDGPLWNDENTKIMYCAS